VNKREKCAIVPLGDRTFHALDALEMRREALGLRCDRAAPGRR